MRFTNDTKNIIMYQLNRDRMKKLKPNEWVTIPETCRNFTFDGYSISTDQLMHFPRGEVNNLILTNNMESSKFPDSSMIVSPSEGFLNFLYLDSTGMAQRVYAPGFDTTRYVDEQVDEVDADEMIKKLTQMTTPNDWWWLVLLILIVVVILIIGTVWYVKCIHKQDSDS